MANERVSGKAAQMGTRLASGEDLEHIVRPEEGLISRRIFADPEVYERELEGIFGRAWFFIGHESEIPERGDIVARQCGVDPVILVRDQAGVVRAFLNSCRHRGMRLCRTDRDNATTLRCPYHGWAYSTSGELLAASSEHHYGPGELDKSQLGLIPVTRLGSYRGLVFGSWDPAAPSLEEWLGDMRWYMDIIFGRTGEIEFVGVPQIWDVECCWKIATDNFTDNFHVYWTHQSLVELGLLPSDPDFASHGHMVTLNNGHILHFVQGPPMEAFQGLGLPKSLWPRFKEHLNPAQAQIAQAHGYSAGTMWPNFHWLQLVTTGDTKSEPVGILNLRLEIPLSPTRTRMYSWFAIDEAAPADYRKISYETYVRCFGPSGIFDQDDMENWEECTATARGPAAKRYALHHKMGIGRSPDATWPGPGTSYADSYGEMTQRAWYAEWLRRMRHPAQAPGAVQRPRARVAS
ncbi:MAG TPA: Rieske 2Fe-2S domain-containing protein [Steroidobacteraceae bacterium]|jgi:phenylpropionate dioxygenase-like ring-hydroxylating dioxygenase large terminal subunit|nr:Rieske 2Fe-2S domain-containing protein [Steroidobacteraceae bacterium]